MDEKDLENIKEALKTFASYLRIKNTLYKLRTQLRNSINNGT